MDIAKIAKSGVFIAVCAASGIVGYKCAGPQEAEVITKIEKDVVIEEKIIEKPGGERIIERVVKDRSSSHQIKAVYKPKYILGLSGGSRFDGRSKPTYTLSVQRRIAGELFMGVYGTTDKEVGLILSYAF